MFRTLPLSILRSFSLYIQLWYMSYRFADSLLASCQQTCMTCTMHHTATYRCDDIRGCVMQFWPPDDEHMCSKHVEAWNKFTVKQKFCATSWLITEINILRCTVSKMSKHKIICVWNVINKGKSALSVIFASFRTWRKSGCTGRQKSYCTPDQSVYNLQQHPCCLSQLSCPHICQQHHYCLFCFLISKAWFFPPKLLRAMLPSVPFKS